MYDTLSYIELVVGSTSLTSIWFPIKGLPSSSNATGKKWISS